MTTYPLVVAGVNLPRAVWYYGIYWTVVFKHCVYMIVLPHLVMIALVSFSRLSGRTSSGSRGVRLPTSSG